MNFAYRALTCVALTAGWCAMAHAGVIFNFDTDAPGTSTSFTDTAGGLSASFTSSADPGGFLVEPGFFSTLTGNVLGDPGFNGDSNVNLMIGFSTNLSSISLLFATDDFGDPSPFTLTAFEGNTQLGTTTSFGVFPAGFVIPEGSIRFQGGPFNNIVLSSTAPFFAIDTIDATPTPEPAAVLLLGIGLLGLGLPSVRRKTRQ